MPAPRPPLSPVAFVFVLVVAAALSALGALMGALAWSDHHRSARLQAEGVVRDAEVRGARSSHSTRSGTTHELRYVVDDGQGGQAGGGDSTGRADLWMPVPEPEWQAARRTGRLRVRVVPGEPTLNAPESTPATTLPELVAGGVVAGLFQLLAAGIVGLALHRRPRAPTPRAPGP